MMKINWISLSLVILLNLASISAIICDPTLANGCPEEKPTISSPIIPNGTAANISTYWAGMTNINLTQFQNTTGILSLNLTWLSNWGSGVWCAIMSNCNLGNITVQHVNNLGINISQTATQVNLNLSINCTEGIDCISPARIFFKEKFNFTTDIQINNLSVYGTTIFNGLVIDNNGFNQTNGNATFNQIYGGMWFDNDTTGGQTMIIASAGVWYNISFNSTSDRGQDLNGFTFFGGNSIRCYDNGLYEGSYSVSFESTGINKEYNIAVSNGTDYIHNSETHNTMTTNSDAKTVSSPVVLRCSPNLEIRLKIRQISGNDDIGIHHAKLFLKRLAN